MKEKCEALERGNVEVDKELAELQAKFESTNSLQEKMLRYNLLSILAFHITRLKASLVEREREKCWMKASKDVAKVCRVFKVDQKVLQHKKDYWVNVLRGIEEEVATAQ